jgi:hypothetical protein
MVPLKFPINISKLIPRDTVVTDAFGLCTKNLRRHLFQHDQVCDDPISFSLRETNPDYHWRVYAYRSTRKTKEDVIGNLRFTSISITQEVYPRQCRLWV